MTTRSAERPARPEAGRIEFWQPQVQTMDDLGQLPLRVGRPDAESVGDDAPLEQPHIAGQEDPVLGSRDASELLVSCIVPPARVEPEHPQVSREPTEVPIQDELDLPQRGGAETCERRDVDRLEQGPGWVRDRVGGASCRAPERPRPGATRGAYRHAWRHV